MTTRREEWLAGGSCAQVPGTPHSLFVRQADLVEAMHDMWLSMSARDGARTSPRMLRYMDERREYADRWRAAIADYEGPQLSVWGPVDPVSGAHVLPRIREVAPGAEVVVLDEPPAVGHYPQVEAPEVVGPLIAGFVA